MSISSFFNTRICITYYMWVPKYVIAAKKEMKNYCTVDSKPKNKCHLSNWETQFPHLVRSIYFIVKSLWPYNAKKLHKVSVENWNKYPFAFWHFTKMNLGSEKITLCHMEPHFYLCNYCLILGVRCKTWHTLAA